MPNLIYLKTFRGCNDAAPEETCIIYGTSWWEELFDWTWLSFIEESQRYWVVSIACFCELEYNMFQMRILFLTKGHGFRVTLMRLICSVWIYVGDCLDNCRE